MSKKRSAARQALQTTSDLLISEIAAGKWNDHAPSLTSIPVEEWEEVIREFALRCPGHDECEYIEALRRRQFYNR